MIELHIAKHTLTDVVSRLFSVEQLCQMQLDAFLASFQDHAALDVVNYFLDVSLPNKHCRSRRAVEQCLYESPVLAMSVSITSQRAFR